MADYPTDEFNSNEWKEGGLEAIIDLSEKMEPLRKLIDANISDKSNEDVASWVCKVNEESRKLSDDYARVTLMGYFPFVSTLVTISHEDVLKHSASPSELIKFIMDKNPCAFDRSRVASDIVFDSLLMSDTKKRYTETVPFKEGELCQKS